MVSHVVGMTDMAATLRAGARQQFVAWRRGGVFIDQLTALQVQERTSMTPLALTDRFHRTWPRAARGRDRMAAVVGRLRIPIEQPVGDHDEPWTFGYLLDTIMTRDVWMHRMDISRALGRAPELTADHDGVLVDDVVTEWAGRLARPVRVHLRGAAGGTWTFGDAAPGDENAIDANAIDSDTIDMDAVELCRTVSGREPGEGLLAVQVPF